MLILRKLLFYLFLVIYLALCPVVILYSLGYIYAPRSEEGLVKTGLIHLESLPPGAEVYLKGELQADKTPCTLSGLLPGRYEVTVRTEDPNYRPWIRTIDVQAGKASVYDHILLLPDQVRISVLIEKPFKNILKIPATRFLLLLGSGKAGDLMVYDWRNNESRELFPRGNPYREEAIEKIFFVKSNSHVLVVTKEPDRLRFLWCDLKDKDKDVSVRDISRLFRKMIPDEVSWEGSRPGYLIIRYQDQLDRADLDLFRGANLFMRKIRGFSLNRGKVYGLRRASLVRVNGDARKPVEVPVDGGRFLAELFYPEGFYRMDFLTPDMVFFTGKNGSLLANLLPYRFVGEGIIGYAPAEDFKKVLVWSHGELGLLDLDKKVPSGALFERGPEVDWFSYRGKDIRQAYFMYGTSHAVFNDADRILSMSLMDWDTEPVVIARTLKESGMFYSERTGRIYYLEPKKGYFVSLEIMPEEKVLERMLQEIDKMRSQKEK